MIKGEMSIANCKTSAATLRHTDFFKVIPTPLSGLQALLNTRKE